MEPERSASVVELALVAGHAVRAFIALPWIALRLFGFRELLLFTFEQPGFFLYVVSISAPGFRPVAR